MFQRETPNCKQPSWKLSTILSHLNTKIIQNFWSRFLQDLRKYLVGTYLKKSCRMLVTIHVRSCRILTKILQDLVGFWAILVKVLTRSCRMLVKILTRSWRMLVKILSTRICKLLVKSLYKNPGKILVRFSVRDNSNWFIVFWRACKSQSSLWWVITHWNKNTFLKYFKCWRLTSRENVRYKVSKAISKFELVRKKQPGTIAM